MPKVSVIVPVYGVEKYIERCARSLFEQTLDDIEYLFIDDCTPDKSIEVLNRVLDEYPQRKNQVIIHRMEKNSGQAAVRKWGILNATGGYVIHCDSDDWVDVAMYEKMYNKAIEEGSDVVVCDFKYSDGSNYSDAVISCYTNDINNFLVDVLTHKSTPSSWNKLIKKTIYSKFDIIYPKYPMAEDLTLISQLISHCESMSYIPEPFYVYYHNINSISKSIGEDSTVKRFHDSIANMSLLFDVFSKDKVDKNIHVAFCKAIMHQKDRLLPFISNQKYYKLWSSTFPEINKTLLLSRLVPLKDKIRIIIVKLRVYPFVRKSLNMFISKKLIFDSNKLIFIVIPILKWQY